MFPKVAFVSGSAVVAAVGGAGFSSLFNQESSSVLSSIERVEQPISVISTDTTLPVLDSQQKIATPAYDSVFEGYWNSLPNKKSEDKNALYRKYVNHRVNEIRTQITVYGISQFDALYKELIDEQTKLLTSVSSV